ncbi:MAG: hypothetical protein CMQ70_00715 [Gammaproteobacteria bacterium]|nr:hypothetical protein [Gammaproteobacteria bacterium]
MKIISHRAYLNGQNSDFENNPDSISDCISKNFDVEIDVRILDGDIFLGHDSPKYKVNTNFLNSYKSNLWIHCKNLDALSFFSKTEGFNYFWHQQDDYTLTSKNYIWTYPGKQLTPNSVIVDLNNEIDYSKNICFGVCTDFPIELRNIL